ncbi:Aste57867_9697 [Aphanomyces stellatus]|uniref:Aste57867_9697 protein n=1 Tax=Aphanomyces stellatus TaxID=120398 RepID=A0A485KNY5_9STRA|nr:hypothetical protein As57867_009659 [Aphanomyces stellatus]VFT86576.1 Aste57867_9697 [Aphanomyces stellatus]
MPVNKASCVVKKVAGEPNEEKYPCRLPQDMMMRVAFFIQDRDSFFRCLEAFVQTDALGNLQRVWNVVPSFKRWCLWPELRLLEVETNEDAADILAVAPFYPALIFDAADVLDAAVANLPQFPHLRTLELSCCRVHSMTPVMQYIRQSKLTSVVFEALQQHSDDAQEDGDDDEMRIILTTKHIQDLTYWFKHQPVESFRCVCLPHPSNVLPRRHAHAWPQLGPIDPTSHITFEATNFGADDMRNLTRGLMNSRVFSLGLNTNDGGLQVVQMCSLKPEFKILTWFGPI